MKIKHLEWRERELDAFEAKVSSLRVEYHVDIWAGMWEVDVYEFSPEGGWLYDHGLGNDYPDKEDAMKACQEDYEQRVRVVLEEVLEE